jgi:protocatechuate 3,4-dioxygenase, beta subunit
MIASRTIGLRRRSLAALGALIVSPLSGVAGTALAQPAPALQATPSDAEGPFYPVRFPADRDFDLTMVSGRSQAARGTRLYLVGRVLDTDGKPLAGVRVELWQCDALGHYHHVDGDRPGDPDFQGYGIVSTDADGRFRFKTIRPVPYASRPAHLHFKLAHSDAVPLTTQLYVKGDGDAGDAVLALTGRRARDRLSIALAPYAGGESGALSAGYDFVLTRR